MMKMKCEAQVKLQDEFFVLSWFKLEEEVLPIGRGEGPIFAVFTFNASFLCV